MVAYRNVQVFLFDPRQACCRRARVKRPHEPLLRPCRPSTPPQISGRGRKGERHPLDGNRRGKSPSKNLPHGTARCACIDRLKAMDKAASDQADAPILGVKGTGVRGRDDGRSPNDERCSTSRNQVLMRICHDPKRKRGGLTNEPITKPINPLSRGRNSPLEIGLSSERS